MKNTRRKHSDAFKTEVALEAIRERKTLSELAQEYQLSMLVAERFEYPDKLNKFENAVIWRANISLSFYQYWPGTPDHFAPLHIATTQ